MTQIAITGGKGGVGKSTVAILLANKLRSEDKSVILCDCDVECPNLHLLLGVNLKERTCPPKSEGRRRVFAQFPKLDKEKCVTRLPDGQECGLCARNCRSNAIFQAPGKYPVFIHELCSGCELCWHLCPHQAIKVEKKIIGEIFENLAYGHSDPAWQEKNPMGSFADAQDDERAKEESINFWLVTGRSVGVVDETGPIVTETRKFAEKFANKVKAGYLLADTSVGMHCGVIRTLIGADLAYAVTEPTPLGAHDLELILNLLRTLKVPAKIVLNQADLGNRGPIDKIAEDFGIKIEFEIPYSRQLLNAYSKGKLGEVNIL